MCYNYYMLVIVVETWDTGVSKTEKSPCLHGASSLVGKHNKLWCTNLLSFEICVLKACFGQSCSQIELILNNPFWWSWILGLSYRFWHLEWRGPLCHWCHSKWQWCASYDGLVNFKNQEVWLAIQECSAWARLLLADLNSSPKILRYLLLPWPGYSWPLVLSCSMVSKREGTFVPALVRLLLRGSNKRLTHLTPF